MKNKYLILAILTLINCACTVQKASSKSSFSNETWRTDTPPSVGEIAKAVNEKTVDDKLEGMKDWWLYGPGMGRTMLNVGTTIIFPPYALYLLTNAGLSLSGYETIKPVEILPEEPKEIVNNTYDQVTSVPGRISALIGSREYLEKLPE